MNAPYTPTPAEIAEATAQLRESWSAAEHYRRAHGGTADDWDRWRPPVVHMADLSAQSDGDDDD